MTAASHRRLKWAGLLVLLCVGIFTFRDLLSYDPFHLDRVRDDPIEDWFFRPSGQSPLLIFGLALCLLYSRHRALGFALSVPQGGGWGAFLLLPATALYVWAIYVGASDLLLISLVFFCLGTAAALGGRLGLQAIFLPAVFLLLLVPMPGVLANQLVYPLQLANAQASAAVLNDLLGIHATSSGTVVSTDLRTFQVVESCAGFRTIATMVMAAVIYADLFQRGRISTALLIVAAPLIGALVNFVRILSLMLHPSGEIAAIHTVQGIVMTVGGVLLLAALDSVLIRVSPAGGPYQHRWTQPPSETGTGSPKLGLRYLLPFSVATALAVSSFLIQPWQPERMIWWTPDKIPAEIQGWTSTPVPVDKNALGSILPNFWIRRAYSKGSARLDVFVATDNLQNKHTSLLSEKTVLPASGFQIGEQKTIALPGISSPIRASVLQAEFTQVLSYQWLVDASSLESETLRSFLAIDRSDLVSPRRIILVRISATLGNTAGSQRRAEAQLAAFSEVFAPQLDKISQPEAL